jgi:hypothetical protein
MAAEVNAGERREVNAVELHGVDVVLAEGWLWCGDGGGGLSTVSRRRRRTTIVGKGAPVEIGGWLGAGEHE